MLLKRTNFSPAFASSSLGDLHPASFVEAFAQSIGAGTRFEFSFYKYYPQSLLDERRTVRLPSRDVSRTHLSSLMAKAHDDEEFAFHSSIIVGTRRRFHLPLIDFAGDLDGERLALVEQAIGAKLAERLTLYRSGRSFHGYIDRPLSESEWVRFMGSLLLTNLPGRAPIADARWVGHRLRAGYSALRWSFNTGSYLMQPTRIPIEEIRRI